MPWRKKPLNQRFQDTYNFIQTQMAGFAGVDAAVTLIDLQTRVLDAAGQLVPLVETMSLGFRWELKKSADETRRRQAVRAVLLGYATLGDPDQGGQLLTVDEVKATKNATEQLAENALIGLLTRMIQQSVEVDGGRTFVGFDTTLEKQNTIWAEQQITEAITKVQMALGGVGRIPKEATRFQTWFGNSDPKVIRTNYGMILAGIRNGVMFIKDEDPANDNVFGYVYPDGPNNPPRVYLCGAFWRAGKVSWQSVGGVTIRKDNRNAQDNPLGVLLHELSHIFVRTDDHEYGQDDCKQLAIDDPALARMNADNYEYYAESVMMNP